MHRSASSWCLARGKRGQGSHRRTVSASRLTEEPQTYEYNEQTNDSYSEFLLRVSCPLCSKVQSDKGALMKHLKTDCTRQKKYKTRPQLSVFQILPHNVIKCRICKSKEFATFEMYFHHLTDSHSGAHLHEKNHTTKSLYCVSCKMQVPNNQTQLESHLKNDFHLRKRKPALIGRYLRAELGSTCIFGFFDGKKMFKCHECIPPAFISTPLDLIGHFKTANHSQSAELPEKRWIHCNFCEINISIHEVGFHFISAGHLQMEEHVSDVGRYETCPFCGFSSDSVPELTEHVTLICPEVKRENECSSKVVSPKPQAANVEDVAPGGKKQHKINRKHSILVKDDVDIVSLIKILKKIGDIKFVGPYFGEHIVIEFKKEPPIEEIYCIRQLYRIDGKKIDFMFL